MKELENRLKAFDKWELEDFMEMLGAPSPGIMPKSGLVRAFASYLRKKPLEWLRHLSERDLLLMERLVNYGPERRVKLDHPDYPSLLEITGLIDVDNSDESCQRACIPPEIYAIVNRNVLEKAMMEGNITGQFEVERVCLGLMNLYGVVPYGVFVSKMVDCLSQMHDDVNAERIAELLNYSPIIKLNRIENEDGDFMVSPCVDNVYDVLDAREEYGDQGGYADFSLEEVIDAGVGAPFFTVGIHTPEGEALVRMIQFLGYRDEEDIATAIHDIWMDSQFPENNEHIYDIVNEISGDLTYFRYCDCLKTITEYVNSIPKWLLSGHSAKETGSLVLSTEVAPEEELPEDVPHWEMPGPSVSEGYPRPAGFPLGLGMPHVAPDDPCPCGSGLKYRSCHGKYLS